MEICNSCEKALPSNGFFCGNCLAQFKCKSCGALLEKDSNGCIICGTAKDKPTSTKDNSQAFNVNAFRFHETSTERTIEATFSDNVGKDIAEILKDNYSNASRNFKLSQRNAESDDDVEDISAEDLGDSHKGREQQTVQARNINLPNLMTVAIKNLPSSEIEWLIVYCFYASSKENELISRKSITDKHSESKRKNDNFSKNLTRTINNAVKEGYINPMQDGIVLLKKGTEKVNEIIHREIGTTPKIHSSFAAKKVNDNDSQEKTKKAKPNNEAKSLKRISELNLEPEKAESLKTFYKKFSISSDHERNLVFTYYLQEILEISAISASHIYTCYDDLGLRVPENLAQSIRNTRAKKGWITTDSSGNILSMKGRNQMKAWINTK